MRDLIVIFSILIIIFGGNFIQNKYLDKSTKELMEIVDKMKENINSESAKKEELKIELLDKWESFEKIWITLQYHQSINIIEDNLIEAYTFFLDGKKTEFLFGERKLRRNIDDMKNREKITLENIL